MPWFFECISGMDVDPTVRPLSSQDEEYLEGEFVRHMSRSEKSQHVTRSN